MTFCRKILAPCTLAGLTAGLTTGLLVAAAPALADSHSPQLNPEAAPTAQPDPAESAPGAPSSEIPQCGPGQFVSPFSDVRPTDWAYEAVVRLAAGPLECFDF